MSPEQAAADKHIDHRADIYAVGAVAYELLTGRPPFTGTTPQELLSAQVTQAPDPVTKYRESVPPALAQVVMKCLEKKAADRWQSAEELLPQLEALATPSGGITPTGTMPVDRVAKRRWMMAGAAVGVIAVIAVVLGVWLSGSEAEGPPRLVVLPFENLGGAEDEYFAAGMTDEIRNRLSQLSGLDVIARTSSDQYVDSDKGVGAIADELDVEYVLEGTVRWAKPSDSPSRVRVNMELVRGSDETQIWAEPFEAVLDDVFQLQGEVAERVAQSLRVVLSSSEQESLAERSTDNPDAYASYLRGQDLLRTRPGSRIEWVEAAARSFTQAIELDPEFALAYARLAFVNGYAYWWGDRTEEQLAEARSAAETALRLDPDLAEGHLALGLCHYWGGRDYDNALRELGLALRAKPDDPEILNWTATVQRRAGKLEEAETMYLSLLELDPRSQALWTNLTGTQRYLRKFEAAEESFRRRASLFGLGVQWGEIAVQLWGKGSTAGALRLIEERSAAAPLPRPGLCPDE
jgi:serine/threonine-protein kinase